MWSHEPVAYACPVCAVVAGQDTALNVQTDVVYRDSETTAFVCPKWWVAAPAHILVVPNDHHENVYVVPEAALAAVYRTAKLVAAGIRSAYDCEGTSMRQHNEPGGGQDAWHFHVHVFPRRIDDRLYERNAETRLSSAKERAPYAERLRETLRSLSSTSCPVVSAQVGLQLHPVEAPDPHHDHRTLAPTAGVDIAPRGARLRSPGPCRCLRLSSRS